MTAFHAHEHRVFGLLPWHARVRGERVAVRCGNDAISWSELEQHTAALANRLRSNGLAKGDRIGLLAGNSIAGLSLILAALRAGHVIVPLSTMLQEESLRLLLVDSGAKLLVVDAGCTVPAGIGCEALKLDDFKDMGRQDILEPETRLEGDDPAFLIYSSGTTGHPKGILHPHRTRDHLALALAVALGIGPDSTVCATTPLYSNGTWLMLLPALLAGAEIVLLPKFGTAAFFDALERRRVSHAFLVPAQFAALLEETDREGRDLSSIQTLLAGGAAFPEPLKQRSVDFFGPCVAELYGCTEGIGTLIEPRRLLIKPGSVGRPLLGTELAILDGSDRPGSVGTVGEVVGKGPGLMLGYHGSAQATAEATWQDSKGELWFRTGDIGRVDEDGDLMILDRKKDMIVSGGLNVFASDVEAVLLRHPQVADAAVIGIADARWGETPVALVIRRERKADDASELLEWANARLAKHQRLSDIQFVDDFPRNALGKVLKRELREHYLSR